MEEPKWERTQKNEKRGPRIVKNPPEDWEKLRKSLTWVLLQVEEIVWGREKKQMSIVGLGVGRGIAFSGIGELGVGWIGAH